MISRIRRANQGFTLIEIIIAVAVVAIMAAAITPLVIRHLDSAKLTRAKSESEMIASAVLELYKDTGYWPITNVNGPSGTSSRVVSSSTPAVGTTAGAQTGAANWGTLGTAKHLGDFLYWNNPDDDTSATGNAKNQTGQDYRTTGDQAWSGPYISDYNLSDPWGHGYVINTHYLPGGAYDINVNGSVRHKVFVLSAGPNGLWETGFSNNTSEEISGDDIGTVLHINN